MRRTCLPPVIGRTCWTYALHNMQLPEGLLYGDQVVIVGEGQSGEVVVRDFQGKEYSLHCALIDCGRHFEVSPGEWRHEGDSSVLQNLRDTVLKLTTNVDCEGIDEKSLEDELALLSRILIRQAALKNCGPALA
jgi:hypothetical protein